MRAPILTTLLAAGTAALLTLPLTAHAATLSPALKDDLHDALATEAFDYAAHTLRAEQAERDGSPAAAAAFTAAATEDRDDHLRTLAGLYGLVGTDAQNLQAGIDGETYEATVMYPEFAATATAEGCDTAASLFKSIAAEEWMHARKYRAALSAVTRGTGSIPKASSLQWITVRPSTPLCGADSQTTKNLATAMRGEALAKAKYALFAEATDNAALRDLFAVTGEVEFREHFSDQANLAGLLGDTPTNLSRAAANETWEATVYYPRLAAAAASAPSVAAAYTRIATDEAEQAATFGTKG